MAFGVSVDFTANVARFSQQVDRIRGDLSRFQQQTRRTANITSTAFKTIGTAAAGFFSVASFKGLIDENLAAADSLKNLSTRIGASVEALTEYKFLAEQTGVSFNTLSTAWQRQTRRISEAARGTGVAKNALEELGLSAQDLRDLAPEVQFEIIAEKMDGIANQSDKVRLAMQLWDTEGVALLQTIEGGTAAINEMREEANRLGLSLSQAQVDAANTANQAIDSFNNTIAGSAKTLAFATIQSEAFRTGIVDLNSAIGLLAGNTSVTEFARDASEPLKLVSKVAASLKNDFANLAEGLGALVAAGSAIATGDFDLLTFIFEVMADNLQENDQQLEQFLETLEKTPGELNAVIKAEEALEDQQKNWQKTNETLTQSNKELNKSVDLVNNSTKKQTTQLESLIDRLFPAEKAQRKLKEEQELLKIAVDKGVLTWEEYDTALETLNSTSIKTVQSFNNQGEAINTLANDYKKIAGEANSAAGEVAKLAIASEAVESVAGDTPPPGNTRAVGGLLEFSKLFKGVSAFAGGGSFMVGGSGGTDSQLVAFRASPDERVTVETPAQQNQSSNVTNNFNITLNNVQNAQQFVDELENITRTQPITLNVGQAGVIAG